MIVAPKRAPQRYKLTAYDLEWRPSTMTVSVAGAYDERGYRAFRTVREFLRSELTRENQDRRFYAHFGGGADMVFILRALLEDESYSVRACFSGSAAIIVQIERNGMAWTFLDSFWLMRTSLAKIAAWLGGESKGSVDFETASFEELAAYNEPDCRILWTALERFQSTILDDGGELRATAASTSLDLFLRKYLKAPIRNSKASDEYARPAYVASRVEKHAERCERANYYDINSSFPFSMTGPLPGSSLGASRRLPDSGLWIADVDLTVSESEYAPPVPYRAQDGRVFFPWGKFRARITSEDALGGGFTIDRVHSCERFEERDDWAAFARDMYARRKEGRGFESEVWKIVVNSEYGKHAESPEKQALLVRPRKRPVDSEGQPLQPLYPGLFMVEETTEVMHSHVPVSAMITARSRRILRDHITRAASLGRVYDCDTDSVVCDAELPTSEELGGLKLEYKVEKGYFVGSKLYAIQKEGGEQVIKAKGFSGVVGNGGGREALTFEAFAEIAAGGKVPVRRMLRIRELVRKHGLSYTPADVVSDKGLHLDKIKPKRKPTDDGGSVAWHVGEIDG